MSYHTPFKQCSKCKQVLPLTTDYFHRNRQSPDGFRPDCKVCQNARGRRWYQANKETRLKTIIQYQQAHPERRRQINRRHYRKYAESEKERAREYKRSNPEIVKRHVREYYLRNRDKADYKAKRAAYSRKHYENNKAAYLLKWRVRDARKKSAKGNHTSQDIAQLYKAQNGQCAYCHTSLEGGYEVDHIIPLSRGGSNDKSNLALACAFCNRSKGNKLLSEWKQRTNALAYPVDTERD